jgi:hypothetical protein
MNPGHSRIRYLKHQWDEEDAARDELELEARRKFLEQEANEIFTSMATYFTSLAKALRAIGASVALGTCSRSDTTPHNKTGFGRATTSCQSYCARYEHFLP